MRGKVEKGALVVVVRVPTPHHPFHEKFVGVSGVVLGLARDVYPSYINELSHYEFRDYWVVDGIDKPINDVNPFTGEDNPVYLVWPSYCLMPIDPDEQELVLTDLPKHFNCKSSL